MGNVVKIPEVVWFQEGPGVRNTQYTQTGVKLLNVANLVNGRVDLSTSNRYISEEEAYGKYRHFLVDNGDFIIASSGIQVDYFEKKMGFINSSQLPLCMNTSTIRFKVIDNKVLDIHYFMYYLKTPYFKQQLAQHITGSAQLNFGPSHLKKMFIPLVDIETQHQIAATLDKLTRTIDLCSAILEKLDLLVKSRFVEMFGDPVVNPSHWEAKPLLDIGNCKNGMNFHYDDSDVEIHCLGVGDFKELSIISDTTTLPKISLNEMPSNEYLLQNDDIVFVRSNGNKALVGRSLAVYPNDVPTTFSGFCIRFRKTDSSVTVPYLLRALKTDSIRKRMAGRGANIQNLNQQILSTLEIPIPPIELQNQFADFVAQTDKSKLAVKQVLEKAETLKKALMQEYFG